MAARTKVGGGLRAKEQDGTVGGASDGWGAAAAQTGPKRAERSRHLRNAMLILIKLILNFPHTTISAVVALSHISASLEFPLKITNQYFNQILFLLETDRLLRSLILLI